MVEVVFEDAELVWPMRYLRSGRPVIGLMPPRPARPPPGMRPAAAINAAVFGSLARLAVAGSRPERRLAALATLGSFLLSAARRPAVFGSMVARRLAAVFGSAFWRLASSAAVFGSLSDVERFCLLELLELLAFDLLLCWAADAAAIEPRLASESAALAPANAAADDDDDDDVRLCGPTPSEFMRSLIS